MRLCTTNGLPSRDHAAAIVTGSMAVGSLWTVHWNKEFYDMTLAIQILSLGGVCLLRSALILRSSPGSAKSAVQHAGWLGVLNLTLGILIRLMILRGVLPTSRLWERLCSQGNTTKIALASLPTAITEQGYASQVLSNRAVLMFAATYALCTWICLGTSIDAFVSLFASFVLVPWMARKAVQNYTSLLNSQRKTHNHLAMQNNKALQCTALDAACNSDSNLETSPLRESSSGVYTDDLKPAKYISRFQHRHQVAVKLNTSLRPSDLPAAATQRLRQAIHEAGLRSGHTLQVLSATIREGCILLSAEVLMSVSNDQLTDSYQQPIDVMQLAQTLVPDLLTQLGFENHTAAGVDTVSLQVGQADRVVASRHSQLPAWSFKQDPDLRDMYSNKSMMKLTTNTSPAQAPTPMLGLVRCVDLPVFTVDNSGGYAAARPTGHHSTHHTHMTLVNQQLKATGSSTAVEPAGSCTNDLKDKTADYISSETDDEMVFKVQVEIYTAGLQLLVKGQHCAHKLGSEDIASKRHLATLDQCKTADGSYVFHIVAQGSCGYGDTHVLRTLASTAAEGCAVKIHEVEVRLPAASLARHHEGGPCAALQPLTLELWAGDAWVSTTHCILPLTDTPFGWWGNIPASVAVAAAQELQAAINPLFTRMYSEPSGQLEDEAHDDRAPNCEGMQDLNHDVNCWLATIAAASRNSGHCMVNTSTAAITSMAFSSETQPFVLKAGLPHADDVLQLQADLLEFATAAGFPALQTLLKAANNDTAVVWPSMQCRTGARTYSRPQHQVMRHRMYVWMCSLRAAAVGAGCAQCEALYEQRLHTSLGAVYGTMSLLMGIAGLVGVCKEGALALLTAVLVALWGIAHIILGSLLLSGKAINKTLLKQLHSAVFSLRFLANFLITIGAANMLPSVARQHQRFTWVSVYLGCSLAERSPLTGVWPTWFSTVVTVIEGCMLFTVTCVQYPVWWRAFWSFACTLGIPLILDAHLRHWLLNQQQPSVRHIKNVKLHSH